MVVYKSLWKHETVSIRLKRVKLVSGSLNSVSITTPTARTSQLLATCRMVAQEALPVFFDTLSVHVEVNSIMRCIKGPANGLHPQLSDVRHLFIDVDELDLHELGYDELPNAPLPNLRSVQLACTALHWVYRGSQVGGQTVHKGPDFSTTWLKIGMIAQGMKTKLKLGNIADHSVTGRRVIFDIS